jgi:lysocardiolipin and lysophospholipid acyltransferase
MQCGAFIFINRNWEEDKIVLTDMINYFSNIKHKTQVMIFPEGTDLTPRTKARSDEFARKNNLDPYEYVLHPRTTGFTFVSNHMRKRDFLDVIYDVTVAYPHNFPQSEPELVGGNFPREVHFHVRRHDAADLPSNETGLEGWCKDRWTEKEEKLRQFYQEKKFTDNSAQTASSESQAKLILRVAFTYWTSFVLGIIILLIYSSLARWFLLLQTIFFLFMSWRGGYDIFQAQYCNKIFESAKQK